MNNSNTFVSQAARYGTGALEHGMNMAFHGLPVGTIGRGALEHLSTAKMAQQALAPGGRSFAPQAIYGRAADGGRVGFAWTRSDQPVTSAFTAMTRKGHHPLDETALQQMAKLMQVHHETHPERVARRFGVTATYVRQLWRSYHQHELPGRSRSASRLPCGIVYRSSEQP